VSRLLIVEDSPTQAEELRLILEDAGHQVVTAGDAERALARLGETAFELVLSDIVMPTWSGYELCRRIKGAPATRAIPVVLLTTLHDPAAIIEALECGADGFLTKPCEPRQLVARVAGVLESGRAARAAAAPDDGSDGVELSFRGQRYTINATKPQILGLLVSAFDEAVRTTGELERRNAELLRAQRLRQDLAAFIVHDLKNPVNAAALRLKVLMRKPTLTPELRAGLELVHRECDALTRMVLDLLDVSRADDAALAVQRQPIDLVVLVETTIEAMRPRAEERAQRLVAASDAGPLEAAIDPALVGRVLQNLVDNSMKYAPEESAIEIGARAAEPGWIELRVADEGPGIPAGQRERIFDKYAQLERDLEQGGRTSRGLGLAFCRLAVEAHGGAIAVGERRPTGSVFSVRLPRGGPGGLVLSSRPTEGT
jgi:signal transduction histidine kinase